MRERCGAQRDWVQWFELWKDPCRRGAWQVLCESRAGSAQGTFLIQSLDSWSGGVVSSPSVQQDCVLCRKALGIHLPQSCLPARPS